MMFFRPAFRCVTFLGSLLAVAATGIYSAEGAPLRLRVENVVTLQGVVITDNAAGDLDPTLGSVVFSGAVGGFPVSVDVGTSNSPGGPIFSELELTSVTINTVNAATLRVTLEDDDYTRAAHKLVGSVGGVLTAPAGSSITFNSWINLDNLVPALGADVAVSGPLAAIGVIPAGSLGAFGPPGVTVGPGAFSATATVGFPEDTLYSLFAQATVTFTGAGNVSFVDNQRALPAPATVLLLALALPVVAFVRRHRPD